MRRAILILSMVAAGWFALLPGAALADPSYIYGLHDSGGESNMGSNKGWIVFTEAIGHNPADMSGGDYSSWGNQGYGVVVRLNNGYGSDGTIPYDTEYANFATRCANFVSHSSGVLYWIIANETNGLREWPGNNDSDPSVGQPITVARYANCYNQCYTAIKAAVPSAKLIPSPVGTWGPPYSAQGIEGFMNYWTNMLNAIGASKIDALAIHTYTHGCDPALITDTSLMGPPYETIYYNFQVYRQYMAAIPTSMNTKPVLITESDQNIECADGASPHHAWSNVNNGWVRAAYAEINTWNQTHSQKIRCLVLFRWIMAVEGPYTFGISDRNNIITDFQQAVAYGYIWGTTPVPPAPTGLTATPGDCQVALAWNSSSGATSYKVKRSTTSGGPYTVIATPTVTSYTDLGRVNGVPYYYVVSAVNASGESANSSQASATPSGLMNGNTPTGTNLSLTAPQVSTDSNYSGDYTGAKAIDGVVSAGSKWCSNGNAPPHWIALDLGSGKTVNGINVRMAGAGGELTTFNFGFFKFQSGTSISGPWTDECTVDNGAQANVVSRTYYTPKALQYVRLYVTNTGVDNYARLPEFEVLGTTSGSGMEDGTPSGSNVAPASSQVSTDSNYSSSYTGAKAIDGVVSAASKWCSNGNAPPHWIALDLGSSKTVTGFIARMAGAAGEYTTYNFEAFKFQSGTSISGPWTDECTVSNSAQASVISRRYITAKPLRYVRLYITDAGTDNYARLPEFEVYSTSGGPLTVAEDFNSMPSWSSSFDASWGSAATWSIVAGGQSGNALQAARSAQGSSAKAMVYNLTANTNYTISVYIKCPSYGSSYWAECAYRLGSYTAQNFDESGGSWTMIKKFANDGTNGNGNTWTQYSATFNSGSSTQISVGYKLGSSGGAGPTVLWDTLRVQ